MVARISTPFLGLCLIVFVVSSEARCEPNKLEYELRERCGRRVAEVFYHEHPKREYTDNSGFHVRYFQAHYDPVSNRCFYIGGLKSSDAKKYELSMMEILYDVDENSELGEFFGIKKELGIRDFEAFGCNVGRKRCSSEKEWRDLIKPMMGETD